MRRPSMILIAAAILIPLVGPVLEGQQELPEVLYNSDTFVQAPVWVSAAAAIDSDGAVNDELFADSLREIIESFFAQPNKGDCYVVEEIFESRINPPNRSTLALAVESSELVLMGRITAADYGFHFYSPGMLLRIEPSEVLHGRAPLDFYYVFFPVGNFTAGPYRICKSDSRYPRAPQVGDELLIMAPARIRLPNDPFLELEEASSVVVVPGDAKPDLPTVFKESAKAKSTPSIGSKSDLVVAVKEALSKKEVKR